MANHLQSVGEARRASAAALGVAEGSAAYQVLALEARVSNLSRHLASAGQRDKASLRGLRILVGRKARLMSYLKRRFPAIWSNLSRSQGAGSGEPLASQNAVS